MLMLKESSDWLLFKFNNIKENEKWTNTNNDQWLILTKDYDCMTNLRQIWSCNQLALNLKHDSNSYSVDKLDSFTDIDWHQTMTDILTNILGCILLYTYFFFSFVSLEFWVLIVLKSSVLIPNLHCLLLNKIFLLSWSLFYYLTV